MTNKNRSYAANWNAPLAETRSKEKGGRAPLDGKTASLLKIIF